MAERPSDNSLAPIERDESYDRTYIPLPGGWEIQTKGNGSTFRLCDPNGRRLAIPEQPYIFDALERMARDIHAAHTRTLDAAPSEPPINPAEADSKLIGPSAEHWRRAIERFEPAYADDEWADIEQRAREIAREGKRE